MPRLTFLLCVALTAVLATGCVPYWTHHKVVRDNENYTKVISGHQKEHADLVRKTNEAIHRAKELEIEKEYWKKKAMLGDKAVKKATEELQKLLEEGFQQFGFAEEKSITITKDNKISIAGDVLFPSGKAELTPKAKEILKNKIVPLLNSKKFANKIIRVEGHTDNQPIGKPETKKRFPTNWHLSAARALSVLMELKKLGISEDRMYAAGYGEFCPEVPNAPGRKGAAKNRRVQIAIMEAK